MTDSNEPGRQKYTYRHKSATRKRRQRATVYIRYIGILIVTILSMVLAQIVDF